MFVLYSDLLFFGFCIFMLGLGAYATSHHIDIVHFTTLGAIMIASAITIKFGRKQGRQDFRRMLKVLEDNGFKTK